MTSNTIQSEIARLEKQCADLEKKKNEHQIKANQAAKSSRDKISRAYKASSESSRKSFTRSAEDDDKKCTDEAKKVSDHSSKIADIKKRIADRQRSLDSALKSERSRDERESKNRQQRQDQDAEKRRRREREHARDIARISRPEVRHVIITPPKPEMLRVLYLTSNPERTSPLRVDAEVNNVLREIRGSKHREQVELHIRPAARPKDLIDGINDIRPHVIHFSGHGDAGLLAFDNASIENPQSEIVQFDDLAELLSATSAPPKLLVMNACSTLDNSEILLEAVPILIGMADSVGDTSAGIFASQFYAAIASAQSIGHALKQAKFMMKQALQREDAELPQIICRSDVDPETMALISTD